MIPSASSYAGREVLVLGATGFIGRWVAFALEQGGARTSLAVRHADAAKTLFASLGLKGRVLEADLADADAVMKLVATCAPAVIFNLAGYGVDPTERDESTAAKLNAALPPLLARAMRDHGDRSWPGQQVVHAGSALEYGTAAGDLAEDTPGRPTTLYGRTKLEGAEALATTARQLGIRAVTARLFTVYGLGEHAGRLLPTLLASRHNADPIPLTEGKQLRDFTYVSDVVDGMLRLGALGENDLGIVNVATGTLTPVRQFVETAADVLEIDPARLRFGAIPTRPEEQRHDPVNVGKLRALTGWVPSQQIRDVVRLPRRSPPGPHSPSA